MPSAVAHFAIRLICGIAIVLCAMPRKDVPSAYFRIMLLVVLGLAVLFTVSAPARDSFWWGVVLASVAFAGSVCWLLERREAGVGALAVVLLLSLGQVFEMAIGAESQPTGSRQTGWMMLISDLGSAATLGSAFTGMLLGHRYLTAPGMPLTPLIWVNGALGTSAIVRFVLSAAALIAAFSALSQSIYWAWLGLRWLAGILGPMAVCVMVHRILRYRNTQAATGVLFVGVILTFIGELTGDLLLQSLHVPF